jgi:hypothetical protein
VSRSSTTCSTSSTPSCLKVKPLLDEVLALLERRDLLATSASSRRSAPDERIVRDVASLKGEKVNYLSLMLVQNPKRVRGELRRLPQAQGSRRRFCCGPSLTTP